MDQRNREMAAATKPHIKHHYGKLHKNATLEVRVNGEREKERHMEKREIGVWTGSCQSNGLQVYYAVEGFI